MAQNYGRFSDKQRQFLGNFKQEAKRAEAQQINDLITNCTNKFQFAKTFKTYEKDWTDTRHTMLTQEEQEGRPKREILVEMVAIGDKLLEDKLKKLETHFLETWGEPITNYVGLDRVDLPPANSFESRVKKDPAANAGFWLTKLIFFLMLMLVLGLLLQSL